MSPYVSIFIHISACANNLTLLWVIVYTSGSALSTETSSMYESELHYSVTEFCSCVFISIQGLLNAQVCMFAKFIRNIAKL